jgi:DNA-binding NarL/FixJ family response regulator
MKPKVLIVDDHQVVAEGLIRLLGDRFDIVDRLVDGRDVVEAVVRLRPDVIILDLSMPGVSGLEVMRRLNERHIEFKAIVLTVAAEASLAIAALKTGASGFVPKASSGDELLTALQVVLDGGTYLAPGVTKDVVTLMVGAADPNQVELTARQQEVLRLIVRGRSAKEIGAMLDLSARSVESMKYRIMQLLQVHSTAELVRYAIEHQLVSY